MRPEHHCIRCDQQKPVNEFTRDASRKSGLSVYCRECFREIHQARGRARRQEDYDGRDGPRIVEFRRIQDVWPMPGRSDS